MTTEFNPTAIPVPEQQPDVTFNSSDVENSSRSRHKRFEEEKYTIVAIDVEKYMYERKYSCLITCLHVYSIKCIVNTATALVRIHPLLEHLLIIR